MSESEFGQYPVLSLPFFRLFDAVMLLEEQGEFSKLDLPCSRFQLFLHLVFPVSSSFRLVPCDIIKLLQLEFFRLLRAISAQDQKSMFVSRFRKTSTWTPWWTVLRRPCRGVLFCNRVLQGLGLFAKLLWPRWRKLFVSTAAFTKRCWRHST